MRRGARRSVFIPLCLVLGLAGACAHPGAVQTDPAAIAVRATQVVKILDLVVDSVIAARDAGWLSSQVTRTIETAIQKALPIIKASPDGAKAAGIQALKVAAGTVGSERVSQYLTWGVAAIEALP